MNHTIQSLGMTISRFLLSYIFIQAGWSKLFNYSATQGFMESMSVPPTLLPLVILLELGGGLAILVGFSTRFIAVSLAAFSVVSGTIFHLSPADSGQMIHFYKNLALAGGFLALSFAPSVKWSIDYHLHTRLHKNQPQLAKLFS